MIFVNDLSPILVQIGPITIQWYGFLLSASIIIYYLLIRWIFKRERYPISDIEGILIYSFFGLVIGARLGEVFFYDPAYYFRNPVEIVKIWRGGLSSHGAASGLFFSYLIWSKIYRVEFTRYVDALVIGLPITAALVRIGNFLNSEIVGKPTGDGLDRGTWGVVFKRLGEDFPRHPVQLYEAALSIAVLIILFLMYRKFYRNTPPLFFLFLFMLLYFTGRFVVEFWKDLHVLPGWFPLSMGQVLSILPILISTGYFALHFPMHKKRREVS
ncbi:MAG: prolipoprotein diacylglyceryl transferase [Nitrospirae bacterium]|nr:prolipoprotein diacylglyceryl transferase [Nitrospirota bacterium]